MDKELSEELLALMNEFFDERSFERKLNILERIAIREDLSDRLIDNLAASMDVVINDGPVEQRFGELKNCVRTRAKYEILRLR